MDVRARRFLSACRHAFLSEAEPLKEHHADVDPSLASGDDSVAQSAKSNRSLNRVTSNFGWPSKAVPGPVRWKGEEHIGRARLPA